MTDSGNDVVHEPHLGAIFSDHDAAESAVEDLRRSGLADEHLGVAVHQPDEYVFEEDVETEMTDGLERGIAIGAPIGAVAGMTVLALVFPGAGPLGVGGILAAGGLTGALSGGFWGAYLGLKRGERSGRRMGLGAHSPSARSGDGGRRSAWLPRRGEAHLRGPRWSSDRQADPYRLAQSVGVSVAPSWVSPSGRSRVTPNRPTSSPPRSHPPRIEAREVAAP